MKREIISSRNKNDKHDVLSLFLKKVTIFSAITALLILFFIVAYILIKGILNLKSSSFVWTYNSENVSLTPALINTILMIILTLLIAVPIGIGTAIYLHEYAKKGNKLVKIIRLAVDTLSGVPSIVYGLFGAILFVKKLNLGLSLISGSLTMSIMILPLIIRTTEEALILVPDSYREGSFGLGAGKLRTVFKVVLPSAGSGILAGIVLGISRIIGESAALIFTAGTVAAVATDLFSSARTLAVHIYTISGEGLYLEQTYATAVVLLAFVIAVNFISHKIADKLGVQIG